MSNILEFLDGKKLVIFAIVILVLDFSQKMGWLSPDVSIFLRDLLAIISGGAVVATNKVLGARNFQGVRVKEL